MKGIEISGGGSHGAITVGRLKARNEKYSKGGGTSTGALMLPLVLLGGYAKLEQAYTSVKTKDITEHSAFTKKGRIHVPKAIYKISRSIISSRYRTLGESKNLLKLIRTFVTPEDYSVLQQFNIEAIVYTYSMSYRELVGFSSKEEQYNDFIEWMWASANAPVVFSLLRKERVRGSEDYEEWVDGGITDGHSAQRLIASGCTEVDLFLHYPKPSKRSKKKGSINNVAHFVLRLIGSLYREVSKNDIERAIDAAKIHKACLRIHYTPYKLSDNSLIFDNKKMKEWVKLGEKIAFDPSYIDTYDYRKK